jgi:hypothetical protein
MSLLYLKADWFVYLFCMLSFVHTYIHAFKTRITIVEKGTYTIDEFWHPWNHTLCLYYIHTRGDNLSSTQLLLYDIFYVFYLTLGTIIMITRILKVDIKQTRLAIPLFYAAAMASGFFIYLLRPSQPFYSFIFACFGYMPMVILVTFKNSIGRWFLDRNVAGAAFMSEAICLYLVYNNIY